MRDYHLALENKGFLMNKLVIAACVFACSVFFIHDTYGVSEQNPYEMLVSCEVDLSDKHKDYQEIAKFFKICMFSDDSTECSETDTYLFSYKKDDNTGTLFHIAWYSDGYIVTQMSGTVEGHQTVVWKDEVIGISYPGHRDGWTIENKYPWGSVWTTPRYQGVRVLYGS